MNQNKDNSYDCQYITKKGIKCESATTQGDYCSKHQFAEKRTYCPYVPTKGKKVGVTCGKLIRKEGREYCAEHNKLRIKTPKTTCGYVPTKGKRAGVTCGKVIGKTGREYCAEHSKTHSKSNQDNRENCGHIFRKGPKNGQRCSVTPKNGKLYCSKHQSNTKVKYCAYPISEYQTCSRQLSSRAESSHFCKEHRDVGYARVPPEEYTHICIHKECEKRCVNGLCNQHRSKGAGKKLIAEMRQHMLVGLSPAHLEESNRRAELELECSQENFNLVYKDMLALYHSNPLIKLITVN